MRCLPTTALTLAATLAPLTPAANAEMPEPSKLETAFDAARYHFNHVNDWNPNPYAQAANPWSGAPAPVSGDDLERLANLLELDDTQREIARAMADELEDEQELVSIEHMEAQADSRAYHTIPNGWERAQELERAANERRRERVIEISDVFHNELRVLLTPQQEERWELVELDRRRDRELAAGAVLFAETLDPYSLADSLDLPDDTRRSIQPLLDEYLRNLDPLLRQRDRLGKELLQHARDQQSAQQAMWQDPELQANWELREQRQEELNTEARKIPQGAAELIAASTRIAQLNRRTVRDLNEALSPDHAPKLDDAITQLADNRAHGFADSGLQQQHNHNHGRRNSRIDRLFVMLIPDDPESEDTVDDFNAFPEEMKDQLSADQLELVTEIEGLIEELYDSGFGLGMMMGRGDIASTIDESQHRSIVDIRDEYKRTTQRVTEDIERLTERLTGQTTDDDGLPQTLTIGTPSGSVMFQRIHEDPEAQQAAMQAAQQAHNNPELKRLHEQRIEAELDAFRQIRQILTIEQRRMIAGM